MSEQTLFDKYGGFASVSRVVMDFYDRLLDTEHVGDFFEDIDIPKMIDHQTKFVSSLLGGPAADYSDARLRQAHAHLAISDAHFDELLGVFSSVLNDHGFSEEDRAAAVGAFEARRDLVVKR